MALGSTPSQPCKCPLCCLAFVVASTCSFVPPSVLSSFFLLLLLKEWWWHLMRPVWGLMAHGWVFEGMGLVSGRKETGLAVWCFVLCGSSTLCVVPLFGTHHPLCLHTSHSYQQPLDGVVRWCESTTVPLSISLFTVCECEWQETKVMVMVTMKAPSHSIAITNTTTTSMSTICTHTHTFEWVVGIGGSSHASWCVWHGNHCHFNTTFDTHTHDCDCDWWHCKTVAWFIH